MRLDILRSPVEVAKRGADVFEAAAALNPRLVAALPTGRTPIEMYRVLAERRRAGGFDLGTAVTFNLDEVLLPRATPQNFFQFMLRHAWVPLGVPEASRFIPDGETQDPEGECRRYESSIAACGGLDLVILGIGADGHIAYNLPGQVQPRTHVVTLDSATLATLGPDLEGPVRAITMGVETILSARKIVLLATGTSKAEALRRMRDEPLSPEWPCTFFRDHPELTLIVDTDAAAQL